MQKKSNIVGSVAMGFLEPEFYFLHKALESLPVSGVDNSFQVVLDF